jgi:hypothetical protein
MWSVIALGVTLPRARQSTQSAFSRRNASDARRQALLL